MIRVFVYALLWILLMGVAIFAAQNTLLVAIKFLSFESINLPLGLVLVFSAGLGAIAATAWQTMQAADLEQSVPRQSTPQSSPPQQSVNFSPYGTYRYSRASGTASAASTSSSPSQSTSTSAKSTPKDKRYDDFDEEWDDDWG